MAFIEICLSYERSDLTSSSSFLQLYILLVDTQQTAHQQLQLQCNKEDTIIYC